MIDQVKLGNENMYWDKTSCDKSSIKSFEN